MRALKESMEDSRRLEVAASSIREKMRNTSWRKVVKAWKSVIARKVQAERKGRELEEFADFRLVRKVFKDWEFAVIQDDRSLYSRGQLLRRSLNKMKIINSIGKMIGRMV